MRLTVGPLPPAVYWRRRAIVAGALLFIIVLLVYNCAGPDPSGAKKAGDNAGPRPGASAALASTAPTPATPTEAPAGQSTVDATPSVAVNPEPQPTGPCTDAEVVVTVAPEGGKTEYSAGTYVRIYLKIKNVSGRSCERDLGSGAQELRIVQGDRKLWSSDDCPPGAGNTDARTLRAGETLDQFNVVWNGRSSTDCRTMPVAPAGTYQLLGRFGSRWSEPVTLTVRAGK